MTNWKRLDDPKNKAEIDWIKANKAPMLGTHTEFKYFEVVRYMGNGHWGTPMFPLIHLTHYQIIEPPEDE